MKKYLKTNSKLWDARVGIHVNSKFYDLEGFRKGQVSFTPLEKKLLGKVKGKTILHLQCHFGMDTISLSRLGAVATGVDFSEKAIATAIELAAACGEETKFILSDVYDLPTKLKKRFDIVFTSFGVIGWLPDLDKWAKVIRHFLKPGGRLVFAEFHPVVWMFDNHFKKIEYSYFNRETIKELEKGTYADKQAPLHLESITWNHSLGEVMQSLLDNKMEIVDFREYDYSPYNCFNDTIEVAPQKFCIKRLQNKIPMVYSIVGKRKSAK